jgi:hypothetical protein
VRVATHGVPGQDIIAAVYSSPPRPCQACSTSPAIHVHRRDRLADQPGRRPAAPSNLSDAKQQRAFQSARSLVFLNGCRTAGDIAGFTQMNGWASGFIGAGAAAFIGSLRAVRSASAQGFAAEFCGALNRDRATLGAASLQARKMIAAYEGDPTWLAYTICGNPAASIPQVPRSRDLWL